MSEERVHVERISRSPKSYTVHVGGTLDEFNTFRYGRRRMWGFQPNRSLKIANVGDRPVKSPRLVINGRRDWSSLDRILAGIVRPGMTDEQKTWAVWDFVRHTLQEGKSYEYTWQPGTSVVRFLNALGTGACGTFHSVMPRLAAAAGVRAYAGYVSFGAHAAQKEYYDGADHYFDAMLRADSLDAPQPRGHFPLALDNRTVPGVPGVLRDRYLIDRCGAGPGHLRNVAYFGRDCNFWPIAYEDPQRMEWELRPGERVQFTWEDCRFTWSTTPLEPGSGSGNGVVTYAPGIIPRDGLLALCAPYPITAAAVRATFDERGRVEVAFGEGDWQPLWRGAGEATVAVPADRPELKEPHYTTAVRFRLRGLAGPPEGSAWFQTYLHSLPALSAGENTVRYEDDAPGDGEIQITHRWVESGNVPLPARSPGPLPGGESRGVFRWQAPPGAPPAATYEFFLSPRADLLHPLLACYHVVVPGEPEYSVPHAGALNPGQAYYWRVRARSAEGAWGDWGETWSFAADVPQAPHRLEVFDDGDGHECLRWSHAGDPARPVRFEVYGWNEDGFTPRRTDAVGRTGEGEHDREIPLPANLIGETDTRAFEITGVCAAFYRIVAVDEAGARSAPTRCVAVPHPKVVPGPLPPATMGRPYRARPRVRCNAGRWIVNLRKDQDPGVIRHGADRLRFALVAAPPWLRVDAESGELSGTPDAPGRRDLFLEVMDGNGRGHSTQLFLDIRPASI